MRYDDDGLPVSDCWLPEPEPPPVVDTIVRYELELEARRYKRHSSPGYSSSTDVSEDSSTSRGCGFVDE